MNNEVFNLSDIIYIIKKSMPTNKKNKYTYPYLNNYLKNKYNGIYVEAKELFANSNKIESNFSLKFKTFQKIIKDDSSNTDMPFPEWVDILLRVCEKDLVFDENTLKFDSSIPFKEILYPFIIIFEQDVIKKINEYKVNFFDKDSMFLLKDSLLRQLSQSACFALLHEFKEFKKKCYRKKTQPYSYKRGDNSTLKLFLNKHKGGELFNLFKVYPVLARLLSLLTLLWTSNTINFIIHLIEDIDQLKLLYTSEISTIKFIEPFLSDPHEGRKSTMRVVFNSGLELMYKPKDISSELAYNDLIKWVNNQQNDLKLKTLKILARNGYGWVECVKHNFCNGDTEIENYYTRVGYLLCIAYLLRGNDYHFENLISCGEFPVFIDHETILTPRPRSTSSSKSTRKNQKNDFSVIDTEMLPLWRWSEETCSYFDVSSIGSGVNKNIPIKTILWKNTNTDNISFRYLFVKNLLNNNIPVRSNFRMCLKNNVNNIIKGFEKCFNVFLINRQFLLGDLSPLKQFSGIPIRYVVRPTRFYRAIIEKTIFPAYLTDGDTYTKFIWQNLNSSLNRYSGVNKKYIVNSEVHCLENLDIPLFKLNSNECHLYSNKSRSPDTFFIQPGYKETINRLASLSELDLDFQKKLILKTFQSHENQNI